MITTVLWAAPDDNLSRYLREIRKFPMLTAEEELALSRRWRDHQDTEAAHKLVTSHLRLVAKVAMSYRAYGLPVGELIGEGNVGMVQAVKRFDPDRGFRLTTYAVWWIRAAILEYIMRSWSLVRVTTTAAQKTLFFNLRRMKRQMQVVNDGDMEPGQVSRIAHMLDVSEQEVVTMNRRLMARDQSLNAPMGVDSEDELQDGLADDAESHDITIAERRELSRRKALLSGVLETLNERERHILTERRLKDDPTTLEELSQQHGISRERVRQIEVRAVEKLQKVMTTQKGGHGPARNRAAPARGHARTTGAIRNDHVGSNG